VKVLYIGYYRENSDWGKQTVNNILALEKAGVDVVCRCVNLNGGQTPDSLVHLEKKDSKDATHCIQHVFPEHMIGTGKFVKNIGLLANNFVELQHSGWVARLEMMDEVWTPYTTLSTPLHSALPSGKVKIVPLAIDTDAYNKRYKDLVIKEADRTFKFYTFASMSNAKGLNWILSSFHSEFDTNDNVSLIIYMDPQSTSGEKELKFAQELSKNVKSLLKLETSPELYIRDIIIATQNLTDDNARELHQYCDCYVSCNTDVTFPLAEIDAGGFGNTPIVSNNGSINEYLQESVRSVNSIYQVVQSEGGMFAGVNNGNDYWIKPDERAIKNHMRTMYNDWASNDFAKDMIDKREAQTQLHQFSLDKVGKKMEEALSV
jgi:glycosyltransferase involved in cell wall biosynthesis